MKTWVKILAVSLIVYSFIAGLLVPLGPGIKKVSPIKVVAGNQQILDIWTYNTHYSSSKPTVFLKGEHDHLLKATSVEVVGDQKIKALFNFPKITPGTPGIQDLTLVINNQKDGNSILPGALFLSTDEVSASVPQWIPLDQIKLEKATFFKFPYRKILEETIRNIYFHVSLWFAMILLFLLSMIRSIQHLRVGGIRFDQQARSYAEVGILFGMMGLVTGMLWATYTWGAPWSFDIKQNMSAVALLIYLAYFVLRSSIDDNDKKSRIAAAYNIFAFVALIPLLFVIPRLVDSLHPGNGGNPALGSDDLDNTMRMVFYPAVVGWMLMGLWMANLLYRYHRVNELFLEKANT